MNKGKQFIKIHKNLLRLLIVIFILFVSPILFFSIFIINFYLKIYPNVYIENLSVGYLTEKQAAEKVSSMVSLPNSLNLFIEGQNSPISFDSSQIGAKLEIDNAAYQAYKIGRSGSFVPDLFSILKSLINRTNYSVEVSYNQSSLDDFVKLLNSQVENPPTYPSFKISKGVVVVDKGSNGKMIDSSQAETSIINALRTNQKTATIKTVSVTPALSDEEEVKAKEFADKVYILKLTLNTDDYVDNITKQRLLSLFTPKGQIDNEAIDKLIEETTSLVNREAENPVFKFEEEKVTQFSPSKDGLSVKRDELERLLISSLLTLKEKNESQSLDIPVSRDHPESQIGDINNLGIKELLGRGTSKFSGSISSRIHNVALASSRLNGSLVAPGEIFSFAKAVGDVSKYTGYKEAYIIQNGRTILGDGGGVCQVSTTLFRAVMNAGLPIIERHSHAYRVGYYEQDAPPGYDATVYLPSVDFKFKNDTQNYILVQTKVDTKNLTAEFSIYGTKDGRESTVSRPILTNQSAPPDDLYVDDPTLPAGKIQQVEHKAWGGTSTFYYTVKKDGKEIYSKKFISVYQPWQAVFMRGTGQ